MSVSALDTLMQLATPARPVEPPARSVSEPSSFAPSLERAYEADKPRERPAIVEEQESRGAAVGQARDSEGRDHENASETDDVSEAAAVIEETDQAEDEPATDEVEISELASSVAASAELKAATPKVASEEAALDLAAEAVPSNYVGDQGASQASENGGEGSDETKRQHVEQAAEALKNSGQDGPLPDGQRVASAVKAASKARAAKAGDASHGEGVASDAASAPEQHSELDATAIADELGSTPGPIAEGSGDSKSAADQMTEKSGETKATKGGAERVELPPIEQTAEQTTAIERHVGLLEQADPGGVDANSASPAAGSPAEAAGNAATPSKSHATLDRLAAASLRRNEGAGPNEGGPAIDRHRFVQRVEGAMKAAQQRDGRLQVRLAPPELGSLRIELSVQNGVMAAKLEAETPAARNALLDNLPALRERLAEQNIRVEKFDVDIRRDSQGSGGNSAAFDGRDSRNEAGSHDRRDRGAALPQPKTTPVRTPRAAVPTSDAGLDVRI